MQKWKAFYYEEKEQEETTKTTSAFGQAFAVYDSEK